MLPLLVNRTKAVLLPVYYLYSYPSPVRISTERGSKTIRAKVDPETVNPSYRCHIRNISPILTDASSFTTGRGYLISFVYQPTSKAFTLSSQAAFSDFRGGDVDRRPNLNYFTPRLFSLPPIAT